MDAVYKVSTWQPNAWKLWSYCFCFCIIAFWTNRKLIIYKKKETKIAYSFVDKA